MSVIPPQYPRSRVPPPEVVDPDLDGDIQLCLASYHPCYQTQQGEEGWLCMVSASGASADSVLQVPVTACGIGGSEGQAKRAAACNLMQNLIALRYPVNTQI